MKRCPICNRNLIWQCDYDLGDVHPELAEEHEGVSSMWMCQPCEKLFDYVYVETPAGVDLTSIFVYEDKGE